MTDFTPSDMRRTASQGGPTRDQLLSLIDAGFDLAIRFGELPDNRINARRIMSNRRYMCASPAYLEKHGAPATLNDLANHRCIVHRQNDDAYGVWRFLLDGRTEIVKVHGALSSNDGDIVLGWALDGQGIVIRSEWDLAKYLESGRLRRVGGFDMDVARLAVSINSATRLAITHIDLLDGADVSRGIRSFSGAAKKFMATLEKVCAVYPYPKVALVSYGPGLFDVLELK